MTKRFPAGSQWRKWDLHVHVPGTALSDGYDKKDGNYDWARAAEIIENSDVAVIGITDYFCAENTLKFIEHYKAKFPSSEKLLLVNVELRLNESVNGSKDLVHFHVIFRDTVTPNRIHEFLHKLPTQITDASRRAKLCSELSGNDFETATVTRPDIKKAFSETFGPDAETTDHVLYLAPASNDGLQTESGKQRKANLTDEIDKDIHAVFGKRSKDSEYFLRVKRYKDKTQISKAKPVFGGCDAHNFADLNDWLGKALEDQSTRQVITWVKADPTFEGLQQTLVEPQDRVSITELRPDAKDDYKVIKKVSFSGSTDFPDEIVFNPNLNAIIGSRSSGKSALLAHIAHAVDPVYTIEQQKVAAGNRTSEKELGPASGKSWSQVAATTCRVEWADGTTDGGRVIYIPQNWLYQISDNPKEVTDKIRPVLESHYKEYFREHHRQLVTVKSANAAIDKSVGRWFDLAESISNLDLDLKELGSKKSVSDARDKISDEIAKLRAANSLNEADIEKYQRVSSGIDSKRNRLSEVSVEVEELESYVRAGIAGQSSVVPNTVSVETYLKPDLDGVPEKLRGILTALVAESDSILVGKVEAAIVAYRADLAREPGALAKEIKKLEDDNRDIIEKYKTNATLSELVKGTAPSFVDSDSSWLSS